MENRLKEPLSSIAARKKALFAIALYAINVLKFVNWKANILPIIKQRNIAP